VFKVYKNGPMAVIVSPENTAEMDRSGNWSRSIRAVATSFSTTALGDEFPDSIAKREAEKG
jgi:hypothetical protein